MISTISPETMISKCLFPVTLTPPVIAVRYAAAAAGKIRFQGQCLGAFGTTIHIMM